MKFSLFIVSSVTVATVLGASVRPRTCTKRALAVWSQCTLLDFYKALSINILELPGGGINYSSSTECTEGNTCVVCG
jgi:hypothetical protein